MAEIGYRAPVANVLQGDTSTPRFRPGR